MSVDEEQRLNSAFTLMRRMPPANTVKSLAGLIELCPDDVDTLLTNIDQPLKLVKDPTVGKDYIMCDYNRDGDGYRSPWTNKYFHEDSSKAEEGFCPSPDLRKLELDANSIFDIYREQYFGTGLSSVYFFDCEDDGQFGACFLIHKDVPLVETLKKGTWDSTHVFDVVPTGNPDEYTYTLTSTVLISMNLEEGSTGNVDLSGSMTIQIVKTKSHTKFEGHIYYMGNMIEENEGQLRNRLESIYIQKTRQVLSGCRSSSGDKEAVWSDIANSLKNSLTKKNY